MRRLPTLGFCVLVVWGLVLSCSSAERQYFSLNPTQASWAEARSHCQDPARLSATPAHWHMTLSVNLSLKRVSSLKTRCYRELVTLTPDNIQHIAKGLTSEHWIGLRKRPLNATDSSTLYPFNDNITFWSRWANGDPLSFQNWYPGHPVFKSPYPNCSCTCPAQPITHHTTTGQPNSTCISPVLLQEPDPDENYIEDPCVAMLSFGAWVEKECSELLPFVCYEDRFYGKVNVTDIKSTRASISWDQGPGDITHYRVEVHINGSTQLKVNHSELTYSLSSLEPGTFYSVKVFPVKCGRDLNPENGTFYTVPNKVTGLQVVDQREKCVDLKWTRPTGNADLYIIETKGRKEQSETENATVCGLTAGSLHTFSVSSGVRDQSQHSEVSTIDAYTRPAKISNLRTNVTSSSLTLSWDKPQGSATGYRVTTSWKEQSQQAVSNTIETAEDTLTLEDLPSGTEITLSITALANSLEGETVTEEYFTKPEAITRLQLTQTDKTIVANWTVTKGSPRFTVQLFLGEDLKRTTHTAETDVTFTGLFSAAKYTVTVFTVTDNATSAGVSESIFTLPQPPRNPEISNGNKSHLTFIWTPPINTETVQYLVILKSSFWGQEWRETLDNQTTYTFDSLKSGTNYIFSVQTKAADSLSEVVLVQAATDSDEREITLSMVCSSSLTLHCDKEKTRRSAFEELNSHFQRLLGDQVVWKLERMDGADA